MYNNNITRERESDALKLYTIETCPKCAVLKSKLKAKNILFEEITDAACIKEKGFTLFPVLELDDGTFLDFSKANTYINNM